MTVYEYLCGCGKRFTRSFLSMADAVRFIDATHCPVCGEMATRTLSALRAVKCSTPGRKD